MFIEYFIFFLNIKQISVSCKCLMYKLINVYFFQGLVKSICSGNTTTKEKAAAERIENILVHACDNIRMINTNAQAIECLIRIGEDFSLQTLKKHAEKFQKIKETRSDCSSPFGTMSVRRTYHL